ncbi:MAG: efflux RND transporter permease subunit, partial [Gemmatimonadota bacterium]|nr:efflux RND transporter permease subunit [Gemmatimonadota bacterium]
MIDLSIRRPVATSAIYIGLMALGAYSFRLIPVEMLPDVDYPRLTVEASWGGASPEALEAFVTAPLEGAAQQVAGVRKITSASRANSRGAGSRATVDIEFDRDTRMDFARLELSERINQLRDELPTGVQPVVQPYTPPEFAEEEQTFLSFQMHGSFTAARLAEIATEEIEPVFSAVDGVSDVLVRGAREREVSIELERDRLAAHGLRPADVQRRINDLATLRAPGSLVLEGRQVSLSVRTRVDQVSELEELVIVQRPDGPIKLSDLGTVRERTADAQYHFRINGRPTIAVIVRRETGTNAVRVATEVKAVAEQIQASLPPSVVLELDADESREIGRQLTDLRLRAIAAAIVIFMVLMLFLRSLAAVLIVFATIGFSALIAVNLLYLGGFSLNVLTLAGLAWGFGLIVDNGIVVLENVERHSGEGESPAVAARRGARQVALPVIAATVTTAIVLVPFLFLQGDLRLYYLPLGYAVAFSILASLFVAFTFVPTMTSRLHQRSRRVTRGRLVASTEAPIYIRAYRNLLDASLDHPWIVALLCAAALGGSGWLFDQHVTRGTLWRGFWGQRTYISVQIEFPRGAGLERTDELARSFEERILTIPEVKRFETQVLPQYASIRITFPEELETTQIPVAIKEQMVAYSYQFTGAEVRVYGFGPSFYGGGGSPPNYRLKVYGYNYLAVQNIADELAGRLERFSRIEDVDPNASGAWWESDKEFEYFLAVNREALGSQALSVEELLSFVSANLPGDVGGQRLRIGGEDLPFAVKLAGYDEFDLLALQDLRVPTDDGEVRLSDVAGIERRDVLAQ